MNDKELLARGGEVVAGDMFLNRKKVGSYRNGQFVITQEGQQALKELAPAKPVEVEKPKARKAKVQPEPKPPKPADTMSELDALLPE